MIQGITAKFLAVQVSSIRDYIQRMVDGTYKKEHNDLLAEVNKVLKDCILSQKASLLNQAKSDFLGHLDAIVNGHDFMKISMMLEKLTPAVVVVEERVARVRGGMNHDGSLNPSEILSSVNVMHEVLQRKIKENDQGTLQSETIESIEALHEVIRRLVLQQKMSV